MIIAVGERALLICERLLQPRNLRLEFIAGQRQRARSAHQHYDASAREGTHKAHDARWNKGLTGSPAFPETALMSRVDFAVSGRFVKVKPHHRRNLWVSAGDECQSVLWQPPRATGSLWPLASHGARRAILGPGRPVSSRATHLSR